MARVLAFIAPHAGVKAIDVNDISSIPEEVGTARSVHKPVLPLPWFCPALSLSLGR